MSAENDIEILRMELRMAREREAATERRLAALELAITGTRQAVDARLFGENDPDSINAKLRRLQADTGTISGGGGGGGAGSGDTGPATWADKTPAQKVESVAAALCGATVECVGPDIHITFPGLNCA